MKRRLIISKNHTHLMVRFRDFIRYHQDNIHHVHFSARAIYMMNGEWVYFTTENNLYDKIRGMELTSWEGDADTGYFVPEKFYNILDSRIGG